MLLNNSTNLELELVSIYEFSKPLVSTCYFLEGDGVPIIDSYDKIMEIQFILNQNSFHPNIRSVINNISGEDLIKKKNYQSMFCLELNLVGIILANN